jgi:formylglycine-generating enzyme required for sulfatase activity
LVALCGCEAVVRLDHFDDGCPPGRHGPTSVRIDTSSGSYCIDSTEVTIAQYQEFLGAVSAASLSLRPSCAGKTDFRPRDFTTQQVVVFAPGEENFPVDDVSWCDAYAYCAWAGKRMCGQIGGGPLAEGATETEASLAQWYGACSRGGALPYPYGSAFNATTCGGMGAGAGSPLGPVAQRAGCIGGYAGIHDMVGSVWEWNDVCDSNDPMSFCRAYGGAYDAVGPHELSCTGMRNWSRQDGAQNIGIRCCTDL